jgi:hypothetical protein
MPIGSFGRLQVTGKKGFILSLWGDPHCTVEHLCATSAERVTAVPMNQIVQNGTKEHIRTTIFFFLKPADCPYETYLAFMPVIASTDCKLLPKACLYFRKKLLSSIFHSTGEKPKMAWAHLYRNEVCKFLVS